MMGKEMSDNKASQFCEDLIYFFSKNFKELPYYRFKEFCEFGAAGEFGRNYGFDIQTINGWIKIGMGQVKKPLNEEYMLAQEKIGHLKRQFREMVREKGLDHCLTIYPNIGPLLMMDPNKKRKSGLMSQIISRHNFDETT